MKRLYLVLTLLTACVDTPEGLDHSAAYSPPGSQTTWPPGLQSGGPSVVPLSACPDPNNCTPPEQSACPDPNNCTPPEID